MAGCLTPDQRTKILEAMKGKLGTLIQTSWQFHNLLDCDKLVEAHRTEILVSLQPEFLEIYAGRLKIAPQRISSPDFSSNNSIQQFLKEIIAEYTTKILLEAEGSGCCVSFFSSGIPLRTKRSAAIKMLHNISNPDASSQALLCEDEALATQQGRLNKIHSRLLELRKIMPNSLSSKPC